MRKFDDHAWQNEFSVGNRAIDLEHKVLLDIVNELIDLIEKKKGRRQFAIILSKLTDYGLSHFKHEERYMEAMNYPNLELHRRMHLEFIHSIAEFNQNFFGQSPPDPIEVVNYVTSWWSLHIRVFDREYEHYKTKNNIDNEYRSFSEQKD